jgi:hypothetical protein
MKNNMLSKASAIGILVCLISGQIGFAQVAPRFGMPAYLQNMPPVADQFRPVHLRAVSYDQESDDFDLLLDKGDAQRLSADETRDAAQKLMEYFRIGLQLPNSMFWVNLRPDAPDNVIDPYLEKTDVGKILLEADLQLKKDLARLTSPDTAEGKQYWDKLYQKAESIFGSGDIEIPTVTRPWIVPGEIILGEASNNTYIYKATLKVMLEQDYLKDAPAYHLSDPRLKEINSFSSELLRELILPKLTRQVNASKRYAALRQVYYSLILAQWFKSHHATGQEIDQKDLTGLVSGQPWSRTTYYKAYRTSFSNGEYTKQDEVRTTSGISIRTYTSGGITIMPAAAVTGSPIVVNAVPGEDTMIPVRIPALLRQDGGSFTIATGGYKPDPDDPQETIQTYRSMFKSLYKKDLPGTMPLSLRSIPVQDLMRSQPEISAVELAARIIAAQSEKPAPIVVWKEKDVLYLVNGHHRVAAAFLRQQREIEAWIIEPPEDSLGKLKMTRIPEKKRSQNSINSVKIVYKDEAGQDRKVRLDQIVGYTIKKDSVTFHCNLSRPELFIDILWQSFVSAKKITLFKGLTEEQWVAIKNGPVEPRYWADFWQYLQDVFNNSSNESRTARIRPLIRGTEIGIPLADRILQLLLYPSEAQQSIFSIIRDFDYSKGDVLTMAAIEEQLNTKQLSVYAYNAISLPALYRLGLITATRQKGETWAVTGLPVLTGETSAGFQLFFSNSIAPSRTKDDVRNAVTDMVIEKMIEDGMRADDRAGITAILDGLWKYKVDKNLKRSVTQTAFKGAKAWIAGLPSEEIQRLKDEAAARQDGGLNGSLSEGYEFEDKELSVADDGTVSMQQAGRRYVITPEGKWYIVIDRDLMRMMHYNETNRMIAAMKQYIETVDADKRGVERVKVVIEESVDQLMKFLLPSEKEAPDKTQAVPPEKEPQPAKRFLWEEPVTAAHKPFSKLWNSYSRKVKNGEFTDTLAMSAQNIAGFKEYIRPQISTAEKKARFVRDLYSIKNGVNVSSGAVYKFLQLFWSPDIEHIQMAVSIYNHEYRNGPLTVASLSSAANIKPAAVVQYIRILEGAGVIELGYYRIDSKRDRLAVKSKNKELLAAWFGEHLDIDETGARLKDGGNDRKVAGIDMRALSSAGVQTTPALQRAAPLAPVSREVLEKQWSAILREMQTGTMPYEHFTDYVAQCMGQNAHEELAHTLNYVAAILRMEEDLAVATPQQIKDILICIR